MIKDYSFIHQDIINIEKWKFEAFEGLVYPSSPLYFNDPYDCEFCFQTDVLESALSRAEYVDIIGRHIRLKQEEKNRILHSDNLDRAIQMVLEAHNAKLSAPLEELIKESVNSCNDEIKDGVRVVCLSEVYDSMLMWSHYACNHTGFCIEYVFEETDMFYKYLHPVVYTNERYIITKSDIMQENSEYMYSSTCRKSDVWAYEKEWRIVTANFNKVVPEKLKYPDGKYVFDLRDNIKAFYLGAKISEDFKAEITCYGKKNGIAVYQLNLSSNTYELQVEKLVD